MRRRFIQQPDGSLLEVPLDWQPEASKLAPYVSDAWLDGTRSPIDGADIGSRVKMREYMKQHGLAHYDEIASDITRAREVRKQQFAASRKADMFDAVAKLQSGYRPKLVKEEG